MLKRISLAFAGLFAFVHVAVAAGTIPGISMSQQLGTDGKPLNGGKLYLIQAGTTATPQNCYQDSGLTIAYPNPITFNAAGRVPQLFCADGSIKVRITNAAGVDQLVQDNLLVVGPSGGGGGGGSVDPTTVLATGDFKMVYATGALTGFVRCNGRTIGNAVSGATERANADTSALFSFLWINDPNLAVSGGRGASAAADYAANKTIALPDCRGRAFAGPDGMGNSLAGRLTSTYFGTAADVLGAVGGGESHTLTAAQLPTITGINANAVTVNVTATSKSVHGVNAVTNGSAAGGGPIAGQFVSEGAAIGNLPSSGTVAAGAIAFQSNNTSGAAHRTVQPTILVTTYIKL